MTRHLHNFGENKEELRCENSSRTHTHTHTHTHTQTLLALMTTPAFKQFLDSVQSRPAFGGIALDSLLVAPLKRISSYIQDLQELRAHTPTEHVDYAILTETVTELEIIQKVRSQVVIACLLHVHTIILGRLEVQVTLLQRGCNSFSSPPPPTHPKKGGGGGVSVGD